MSYARLAAASTSYARRMNRLSSRIWGEVARETSGRSLKVVALFSEEPVHLRPSVVNYYPRHVETHTLMLKLREYGLFRDEHQDFTDEMKRLRALRGKTAPKKGEGKRSKK